MILTAALKTKYPIDGVRWARGYVFIKTFLPDLGINSVSTHSCEFEMTEYEYLTTFLESHNKQVDADVKDYITRELKEGFYIDELLIKKYLNNGV